MRGMLLLFYCNDQMELLLNIRRLSFSASINCISQLIEFKGAIGWRQNYNFMKVKAKDLKLADTIISLGTGACWNNALVKQITDNDIMLFRPHGTTADFSYTGGVICYIGIEEFTIPKNDCEYEVLERKNLK